MFVVPPISAPDWAPPIAEQLLTRPSGRSAPDIVEVSRPPHPRGVGALVRTVGWARDNGLAICLDASGDLDESLSLFPLLAPDIVRIHADMLSGGARNQRALSAVRGYCAHTAAELLVAEMFTQTDLLHAHVAGAVFGQGPLFGLPESMCPPLSAPAQGMRDLAPAARRHLEAPSDIFRFEQTYIASYQTAIANLQSVIGGAEGCEPGLILIKSTNPTPS
ncbi:hypothetical protein ASG12_06710 [Williamsia sp. Leaf354]|uniref:EAL domain-containing protein n=1 Tax=Williamsia sp. Leaf354 TaxID=1736349 RepID=UPI0006FDCFBC|nr:EAL domain-containing protein [Williamsia sp. Leaf354]KQS00566.1 hypothetical protein ASG12_06710 [Williamsia sp. Leaf354]